MAPEVADDPLKSAVMAYVQRVITGELRLAPLPWMASRLALVLERDKNPDWRKIAGIVKSDVILAMQTLGSVNLQAEEQGARICSIDSAVSYLGPTWFGTLIDRENTNDAKPSALLPLHRLVWRHSLIRAELATCLASAFGQWPDEAYTCALLGELGTLAALRCLEELLATHTASAFSPNRCLSLARSYNADILAVLLDPLHLPSAILDETETRNNSDFSAMSKLLRVASTLAGSMDADPCFGVQSMQNMAGMDQERIDLVAGAAMGISASIEYLDCQGADSSLPLSTTIPRRRGICQVDYEVVLEEPSATYSSLHVSGLSMSVQGALPAEPGSVTRMSVHRNFEKYRFAVLVQRCVLGERGYVLDLVHLPAHEEGLVRWQGLVGEANREAHPPARRRHTRDHRVQRGDVSQAFAAIHQEELQKEIAALPGDMSQAFAAIQLATPPLEQQPAPPDEFDDDGDTQVEDEPVAEKKPTTGDVNP